MSTTATVELDGLSVSYQVAGDGPALVLLHGFSYYSRAWRPQIEALSDEFTVIAWDAPGAGHSSDPPETFGISDWADCLDAFLAAIKVEPVHVLGLSWGGILAQEFYRRYPDRVRSLILADTYVGISPGRFSADGQVVRRHRHSRSAPQHQGPDPLILGEADARSPIRVAHQFHDAIPGSELAIIPGAGHVSNMEEPELFNAEVRSFCLGVSND